MSVSAGIFVVIWRVVCLGLLVLVLIELHWAQRYDGDALRALRAVLASMAFVIVFPLVASVDTYADISPGFHWRPVLEWWVWVGYAVLATSLTRFLRTLHAWAKERERTERDEGDK